MQEPPELSQVRRLPQSGRKLSDIQEIRHIIVLALGPLGRLNCGS